MKQPRDFNALAFNPDQPRDPKSKHFIPREGARNKYLAVDFDPDRHKEWVTGFRKRRNERKTAGLKQLEAKAKQEQLEARQERKKRKKEELQLPDDYGIHDSDLDEPEVKQRVTNTAVYRDSDMTTTVTTAALTFDDDDENDEAGEGNEGPGAGDARTLEPGPGTKAGAVHFPSSADQEAEENDEEDAIPLPAAYNKVKPDVAAKVKNAKGGNRAAANKLAVLKAKRSGVKTFKPSPRGGKGGKAGKGGKRR